MKEFSMKGGDMSPTVKVSADITEDGKKFVCISLGDRAITLPKRKALLFVCRLGAVLAELNSSDNN